MATRTELVAAIGERYRAGARSERSAILDEFVAVTGYHRKYAIRLLSVAEKAAPARRVDRRRYGSEVRDARSCCGTPRTASAPSASSR